MIDSQPRNTASIGESYQDGVMTALRLFQDNFTKDKKGFTNIQKGKIMGWSGVTRRSKVAAIWSEIETAKSVEDLRVVLSGAWDKNKSDLDMMFYDIYWGEELLDAVSKVKMTESNVPTHLSSEEKKLSISLCQGRRMKCWG